LAAARFINTDLVMNRAAAKNLETSPQPPQR